jgi:hypothetical protein
MEPCPIPYKSKFDEVQSKLDRLTEGEFSRLLELPCPVVYGGSRRKIRRTRKKAIYGGAKLDRLTKLIIMLIIGSRMYSNCSAYQRDDYVSQAVCPTIARVTKAVAAIPKLSADLQTRMQAMNSVNSIVNDFSGRIIPFVGRFLGRDSRTTYRAAPSPVPLPPAVSGIPYPEVGPYPSAPTYSASPSPTYMAAAPTQMAAPTPVPKFTISAKSKTVSTASAIPKSSAAAPSYNSYNPRNT